MLPREKAKERNKLIFPDRTNFLESVADFVEPHLQVVHLIGQPVPLCAVAYIIFF